MWRVPKEILQKIDNKSTKCHPKYLVYKYLVRYENYELYEDFLRKFRKKLITKKCNILKWAFASLRNVLLSVFFKQTNLDLIDKYKNISN